MTTNQIAEGCKMTIKYCFAFVLLAMSIVLGKEGYNHFKRLNNKELCQ